MFLVEEHLDRARHFQIVGDFCCGADDPLNVFLSDNSFEYDEERYGRTNLIMDKDSETLLAFYTIKVNGIQTYDSEQREYNLVPAFEIARIAVEYDFQQNGLGKKIFYDYILPKIQQVGEMVAVRAVIVFVEPENEGGIAFYKSLGFIKASEDVQSCIAESFNEECDLYVLEVSNVV